MTYARNGHLTAGVDGKPQLETGNTPNTVDTAWEAWIKPALDRVALAGGIVLLGAAAVSTGGTAVMVGGALLSAYGAVTGGVELADRAAHGQTLSLDNAQARNAWLNVGASALSLGAMGASMRLANMSGRATGNAIDEAVQLTRMAQTARGLNVAAQYADTAAFADGGLMLAANWDRMTPAERTQALAMMAFWSAGTAVSARQAGGVKNLYGVKDFSNAISSTHQWLRSRVASKEGPHISPIRNRQSGGATGISMAADEAYAAIRVSTTDIEAIAQNTGFKLKNIEKIKFHLFYQEHLLDRYVSLGIPAEVRRFDSNMDIANAWKRLINGSYGELDIKLLKHEIAEAWYMKRYGPSYNNAHSAAQNRFPSPLE